MVIRGDVAQRESTCFARRGSGEVSPQVAGGSEHERNIIIPHTSVASDQGDVSP